MKTRQIDERPPIRAILIHGMGRTPLSMLLLAARLRSAGMRPALFGYSATLEGWGSCSTRLRRFIELKSTGRPYIIVGHSLGTVLARAAIAQLGAKPLACFFLAPPAKACLAARRMAPRRLYKIVNGEMGQLLASPEFMNALPLPALPMKIYAGVGGPKGRWSPFGGQANDGVLSVDETRLAETPLQTVPSIHTFIMNSSRVARDIVQTTLSLAAGDLQE